MKTMDKTRSGLHARQGVHYSNEAFGEFTNLIFCNH